MHPNETLVLEMIRAVEERDGHRLLEIFDPDVEFVWPPSLPGYGGTYRGADVLKMNEAFVAMWDPVQPTEQTRRLDATVIASSGTDVVVRYHQRGVDHTGRQCDSEVLALYQVEQGKVKRLQMFYFDPEQTRHFLESAHGTQAIR